VSGGFGVGNLGIRFGEPTIRVWHPIVSKVQVRCDCGCLCHVHVDGTLLHTPGARKRRGDEKITEAPPHSAYCPKVRK